MANLDAEMPKELESEFNKIMGIKDTKKSHRKVDPAYTDDVNTDPFLSDVEEDTEDTTEDVKQDGVIENETDDELEEKSEEETEEELIEESQEEAEDASEEAEEIIPDNLVIAGRSAGLADKKIVELFENEPEVLDALANYREQMLSASQPRDREQETVQSDSIAKPEKIGRVTMDEEDLTNMDESTRRVFKTMLEGQNALADKLDSANEELFSINRDRVEREAKSKSDFTRKIDGFFDNTKDAMLGNSSAMTGSQAQARKEVYAIAAALTNANGNAVENNLDKAVRAYHGIYGDTNKVAEDTLRRKLNANKTKFSPRPGGQKRTRKFKNDDERVMSAMEDAARDLGIDLE